MLRSLPSPSLVNLFSRFILVIIYSVVMYFHSIPAGSWYIKINHSLMGFWYDVQFAASSYCVTDIWCQMSRRLLMCWKMCWWFSFGECTLWTIFVIQLQDIFRLICTVIAELSALVVEVVLAVVWWYSAIDDFWSVKPTLCGLIDS